MHEMLTRPTSAGPKLRSCEICCTLAPVAAMTFVSSASEPGRSLMLAVMRHSRPSAARPRSMILPRVVTSMFPPQSTSTTFFPCSAGGRPITAASDDRGIVKAGDEDQAALGGKLLRAGIRLGKVLRLQQHVGAKTPAIADLHQRRAARHDDGDRDPQLLPVIGQGQRVIAGGC